ncbi:MAG: transposase [Mucilaginibacter sp.]|uniref:REP-associated tyrosine transposase n=1 Tax=Mucilaginibacter sp. TaxID=1882438 RepID=UPI003566AD12
MRQGIEFFTATCLNWQVLLQPEEHKQIVLDSLRFLVSNKRIWLYGYVIMPNHIHLLWCKHPEWLDKNVQQHFAKYTAQQIKFNMIKTGADLSVYKSTQNDREYQFWERRPHIATMYNRVVLEQKLDYIHQNPVKAGLVLLPEEYLYSSSGYYIDNKSDDLITHYMEHI